MGRPETVDALADYERRSHEFVKIDPQHLTVDITVGAAVLTLIDVARRSGSFDVTEDGEFIVSVPLSPEELDARLRSAQRSWDINRDGYESALADVLAVPSWQRYSIDQWAKAEDREPIDWTVAELQEVKS